MAARALYKLCNSCSFSGMSSASGTQGLMDTAEHSRPNARGSGSFTWAVLRHCHGLLCLAQGTLGRQEPQPVCASSHSKEVLARHEFLALPRALYFKDCNSPSTEESQLGLHR